MSATERVLAALASIADLAGECSPTVGDLGHMVGASDRWVRRVIGELETAGKLRRIFVSGGRTVYHMEGATPEVPTPEVHSTH